MTALKVAFPLPLLNSADPERPLSGNPWRATAIAVADAAVMIPQKVAIPVPYAKPADPDLPADADAATAGSSVGLCQFRPALPQG